MESNIIIASLIPHGNVLNILQTEQRTLCQKNKLDPCYPLICPIGFFSDDTAPKFILAEYQSFFQTHRNLITISEPVFDGHYIYRKLISEKQEYPFPSKTQFFANETLMANIFLYGKTTEPNNGDIITNTDVSKTEALRVFRIAVISLTSQETGNTNTALTWYEKDSCWIKLNK